MSQVRQAHSQVFVLSGKEVLMGKKKGGKKGGCK